MSRVGSASDPQAVIAGYAPRSLSPAAAAFTRAVLAQAAPATPARAKALLFAAGRLAAFAEQAGLELTGDVVFCGAVIERFVLVGCAGVSPATRRTLRSNLRALARSLERYPQPAPVPLVRERTKQPYAPGEIAGYLRLADAQATHARRLRASALVCLGAGAGVITGELRHVRGSDIVERSGGVLVQVGGERGRAVPRSPRSVLVELLGEKHRRRLQDLVRAAQLVVLLAQLLDLLPLVGAQQIGPLAAVGLGATDA